jgi:putative transcriptional regulator
LLINHHPSDPTLTSYAAGTLPEALSLVTAAHLSFCPACRDVVALAEAVGGSMLDDLPPVAMDDDALTRVLARGDLPQVPVVTPVREAGLPGPLKYCSFGRSWLVAPGLRWRPLRTSGRTGARAWGGLLVAQPGRRFPRHAHTGLELTCVLRGSFVDANGHYGPGDLAEPEGDHDDPPRIDSDEPCVCVIASEGFRLGGAFGLVQRMIGL